MADLRRTPQKIATLGVQIKTERRCKICNSEWRGEIEDLLVLRQRGECMPDGVRPTEAWMMQNAPDRWGMPLNSPNLNGHFKNHFKVGSPSMKLDLGKMDARSALERSVRDEGIVSVAPEEFLETIVSIAHKRVLVDPASVTIDQGMKAVGELTKRKHDEQTASLMQGLVGAVERVAQGSPQPEVLDVVDAEVIEDGSSESDGRSGLGGEQGAGSDAALVPVDRSPVVVPSDQES